eukprot:6190222-Pleurochrysis_carterae.AAC.2
MAPIEATASCTEQQAPELDEHLALRVRTPRVVQWPQSHAAALFDAQRALLSLSSPLLKLLAKRRGNAHQARLRCLCNRRRRRPAPLQRARTRQERAAQRGRRPHGRQFECMLRGESSFESESEASSKGRLRTARGCPPHFHNVLVKWRSSDTLVQCTPKHQKALVLLLLGQITAAAVATAAACSQPPSRHVPRQRISSRSHALDGMQNSAFASRISNLASQPPLEHVGSRNEHWAHRCRERIPESLRRRAASTVAAGGCSGSRCLLHERASPIEQSKRQVMRAK